MFSRVKKLILPVIVGAFLILEAAPALARDYWHWSAREHRWEHRADLRSDHRDLAEARRQLDWDLHHHGSRRKIAEDRARIRDLERDIREDRRAMR